MKRLLFFFSLVLIFVVVRSAVAQGGSVDCDDSPENPTLILAGLAGGVYAVNALRVRAKSRRSADKQ